jgi:CRP/FNR family transcriptional regulator, cyclic AMP receptor protein
MSNSSQMRERLKRQPLFLEFTDDELDEFIDLLDPVHAAAGETIVKQDEPGDCMYLLVEGTAHVVHHRDGRDIDLAALKEGDFFGELALVDDGLRSADVQALTPCTLLKISQAVISALAGVYPSAAFKFLIAVGRILVNRLRQTNQRFVDTLLFPVQGKD